MDDTSLGSGSNIKCFIIAIDTILQKYVYPCETRYADFIRLYGKPHLKDISKIYKIAHQMMMNFFKDTVIFGLYRTLTSLKENLVRSNFRE